MNMFLVGTLTFAILCGLSIYRAYQHPERDFIDRWDATVGWLCALTVYTGKGLFL